jgi:hypothetical protein
LLQSKLIFRTEIAYRNSNIWLISWRLNDAYYNCIDAPVCEALSVVPVAVAMLLVIITFSWLKNGEIAIKENG